MTVVLSKQRGVALILSMLFLLILTLIAISMAQSSRTSSQLAGASLVRDEALQLANGGQENFMEQQRLARGDSVLITNDDQVTVEDTEFEVESVVDFIIESGCRRSRSATSSGVINCRQSEVETEAIFGRSDRGRLSVTAGIEQPVLKMGGS